MTPQLPSSLAARTRQSIHTVDDQVVLVTGGTGSFGRAFVQALISQGNPKKVIVFSRDEQKHYQLERTLRDPRLRFFVGDVRDRDRLTTALRGVDVVVHAAAMKHVPICEYNPIEAVQTNVVGARNLIEAALANRVPRIIASAVIMGLVLWGISLGLGDLMTTPGSRTMTLGVTVVVGMGVYFAAVILTGGMSLTELRAAIRRQR